MRVCTVGAVRVCTVGAVRVCTVEEASRAPWMRCVEPPVVCCVDGLWMRCVDPPLHAAWIVQPSGVPDDDHRIAAASEVRRHVEAYYVFSDIDLHTLRVLRKRRLVEVVEDGNVSLLGKGSKHEAASSLCASAYMFRVPEQERTALKAAGAELAVAVEPAPLKTAHI